MAVTMNAATFMENTSDLTLKKMFDISAKLVSEEDEISELETIGWEKHSWKYLSLIGDEAVINLQRAKVYVFSDYVLCLGKIFRKRPIERCMGTKIVLVNIFLQKTENFDKIDGEPMGFEWNIFPSFYTLQISEELKRLLFKFGETPNKFTGRILFMSMFNDISCGTKDNEQECLANARLVSLYARKFGIGQWSFIGPGSEKKWYSMEENSPLGIWDHVADKMLLEFAESTCPIFRATTPLSRGQLKKAKDLVNCRYILHPIWKRLRLFRTSVCKSSQFFTEQSQKCVKDMKILRQIGATRCGRAVEFLICAERDEDRDAFEL